MVVAMKAAPAVDAAIVMPAAVAMQTLAVVYTGVAVQSGRVMRYKVSMSVVAAVEAAVSWTAAVVPVKQDSAER
jgi:hypothetical protein